VVETPLGRIIVGQPEAERRNFTKARRRTHGWGHECEQYNNAVTVQRFLRRELNSTTPASAGGAVPAWLRLTTSSNTNGCAGNT